jgi:ArsR family transcriptional regulator, arsenate/arsenite/antimonite-responsive transcriptional repressor
MARRRSAPYASTVVELSVTRERTAPAAPPTADPEALLPLLKALADPTRLRLVALLAAGPRCACELQDELDVPPPLLSHHLKALRGAGLVHGTRRGRWVDYRLDSAALATLATALSRVADASAITMSAEQLRLGPAEEAAQCAR